MPPTDRIVASITLRIRYAETDAMGIVHHSNYLRFFEEGRSEYARQRGQPYSSFEAAGYFLVVTEATLRFIKPARYEQQITVTTWVEKSRSRGIDFAYEITDTDSGEILVTGQTKHISIDKSGQVSHIPAMWQGW